MSFVFDNCLSPKLAKGMAAFGEDAIHLTDRFRSDTPDVEWLPWVAKEGHILITKDDHLRWRPAEKKALLTYKIGAFFLGGKNLGAFDMVQQVVRHWPRMKEIAAGERRPFAYRLRPKGGEFEKLPL